MIDGHLGPLFHALFDDAAMFAPRDAHPQDALRGHLADRAAWYGWMAGPLVALHSRLRSLDGFAAQLGADRVPVSMVVPEGPDALSAALRAAERCPHLDVQAVEVSSAGQRIGRVLAALGRLRLGRCYLEVPVSELTEEHAHQLAADGVRLKLRTGTTSVDGFQDEERLARALVLAAAERLSVKCAAGTPTAVRHRERSTRFEQHGVLNIALAARIAAASGSVRATRAVLAERDAGRLAYRIGGMGPSDVVAIRAVVAACTTASVAGSVADLAGLGLVAGR